jgi:phage-related baseplate assembly protein
MVGIPRFSVLDPKTLGLMEVLEVIDTEAILSDRMLRFKQLWALRDPPAGAQYDVDNLEFDPIKINQELNTLLELLLRDRVNQAARATTTVYAIGEDLRAIASRYPGGVPKLAGEDDEHYRRRIWLSPNPLSPHGVAESYEFWALTAADGLMRDATTIKVRPSLADDPVIVITCIKDAPQLTAAALAKNWESYTALLAGANQVPTTEELLEVRRYIIDEKRVGSTDVISIRSPLVREVTYRLAAWLYPGADKISVMTALRNNIAALVEEQRWLGYDHTLMKINSAAAQIGVHHVDILEPVASVNVEPTQFVRVLGIEIVYAGRTE